MKRILKNSVVLVLVIGLLAGNATSADAASKATYAYKTYDRSETYTGKKSTITSTEKYKRVILKGESKAVKKINSTLKAACDEKLKEMPHDYAENDADYMSYDSEYFNVYTSKVTYNEKGKLSVSVSYEWFQGGVMDYGCDNYVFDLNTGKQLKLTDVCKESNKKLTEKIKKLLVKKYSKDAFFADSFDKISADKCDFYLKKGGKAVVVFDKYEIGPGAAGAFAVTIKL